MRNRTFLLSLFLLVAASVTVLAQSSSVNKKSVIRDGEKFEEMLLPLSGGMPNKAGALRLIASDIFWPDEPLTLQPSDPTALETLETAVLITQTIPRDNNRTHLLLSVSGAHSWHQIPSTTPYCMTGAYRMKVSSALLPAPGFIGFGIGLDGEIETQPSTKEITRLRDPVACFALDDKLLVRLFEFLFPDMTGEQRLRLARNVLKAESTLEMTVRVRVRSVDGFTLSNATLQVWGD